MKVRLTKDQKKALATVTRELAPEVAQGDLIQRLRRRLIKKGVVLIS